MKQKKITLMAVAMSIVLSFSACGNTAQTGSVESTESVAAESTESVENSTEAFVLENELSTEESTEESVDTTETEKKTTSTDKTESAGYTYTEDSRTMYAKSTVTVRSLPSTSGSKLGSLSKNQEVTVTGQCNETGWYRISYNNAEGFVSNKYLADEPVAVSVAQAGTNTGKNTSTSTGDPVTDAAIAKYGPNIMIFEDGTIYSTETWQQVGTVDSTGSTSDYTEPAKPADGYNRTIAEQVWAKVNAERTAAGLNALAWDENIYNFACSRAQALVTNYSHEGCGSYGENIYADLGYHLDADYIHNAWYNSTGHHENYMSSRYASGACAVYVYKGTIYAVENFALASSPQTDLYATQIREVNGVNEELTWQQAEAFDNGNYWTASNGVVIYIQSNGNMSCNATGDAAMAALNEYDATH